MSFFERDSGYGQHHNQSYNDEWLYHDSGSYQNQHGYNDEGSSWQQSSQDFSTDYNMETDEFAPGLGSSYDSEDYGSSNVKPDSEVMKMYIKMYPNATSTDFLEFLENFQAKKSTLAPGSSASMHQTASNGNMSHLNKKLELMAQLGAGRPKFRPPFGGAPQQRPMHFNQPRNFNSFQNRPPMLGNENPRFNNNRNVSPFNGNQWNGKAGHRMPFNKFSNGQNKNNNSWGNNNGNPRKRPAQKQQPFSGSKRNKAAEKPKNFPVDANGNYNMDNAQRKLNEYCLKNNMAFQINYDEVQDDTTGKMKHTASFSFKAHGKTVSASVTDTFKKIAGKKCAFEIILQLYKLKLIPATYPDSKPDPANGSWTNETSIERLKTFCYDYSITDDFTFSGNTATFAFKSSTNPKLKHITASATTANRKTATQMCAVKILGLLFKASLVEDKNATVMKRPGQATSDSSAPANNIKVASQQVNDVYANHQQKLTFFCQKNGMPPFDIAYKSEQVNRKWKFTASITLIVTLKDGGKKAVSASHAEGKKKLAAKGCCENVFKQLVTLGLISPLPPQYIKKEDDNDKQVKLSEPEPQVTEQPAITGKPWSLLNSRNVLSEICNAYELEHNITYTTKKKLEPYSHDHTATVMVTIVDDGKTKVFKRSATSKDKKAAMKQACVYVLDVLSTQGLQWPDRSHKRESDNVGLEKNGYWPMVMALNGVKAFCTQHSIPYDFSFTKEEKKTPFSRPLYTCSLAIDVGPAMQEDTMREISGSFTSYGKARARLGTCLEIISKLYQINLVKKFKSSDAS